MTQLPNFLNKFVCAIHVQDRNAKIQIENDKSIRFTHKTYTSTMGTQHETVETKVDDQSRANTRLLACRKRNTHVFPFKHKRVPHSYKGENDT